MFLDGDRMTSYSEVVPQGVAATFIRGAEGDRSCVTAKVRVKSAAQFSGIVARMESLGARQK
jgi:hypothetical protein